MKTIKTTVMFLAICLLAAGCVNKVDMVSEEKAKGKKYSADEIRRITVDQPFFVSGDYFRERDQKTVPAKELIAKAMGNDDKEKVGASQKKPEKVAASDVQETDRQPAKDRAKAIRIEKAGNIKPQKKSAKPVFADIDSFPPKIGILFDREKIDSDTISKIRIIADSLAKSMKIYLADANKTDETVSHGPCTKKRDLLCTSKALGVYPGVRMIVLAEEFKLPKTLPGKAVSIFSLVDTGITARYPSIEIAAVLNTETEKDSFIMGTLQNMFEIALDKEKIMPWFCRVFSKQDNRYYITAGKTSGLKPKDRLVIMAPGKMIKSPAGLPAGWIPGKEKGIMEVELLFERDFAACILVKGSEPGKEDMIVKP